MSQLVEQIISSSRFLADGTKFPCVCCDSALFDFDGFCSKCQAPASLSRIAVERGTEAQFISVIGASGAGKTVYLGMLLDMLTKGTDSIHGLPNNSLSVAVQEHTIGALERRRFPDKTPNDVDQWKWLHCEVSLRKRKGFFDIISPDFAGEAVAFELEHPGTFPVVGHVIRKSHGIIILIDSIRVCQAGRGEDFFALKMASYVQNTQSNGAGGSAQAHKKSRLPLAIILTKCDSCPDAVHDPAGFAAANMPGLERYLDRHFSKYQFFAASVVGSLGTLVDRSGRVEQIPFHISPHGIVEPVEWIVKQ
jgi:hypothetical protein